MEASSKNRQSSLVDSLLQHGQQAFDPELLEETRKLNLLSFKSLLNETKTLALLPALNLLIQPGRSQPWLRAPLISALAALPLRERGVQDTIEFILSVHPSSARADTSNDATKASGISHDALNAASRLLSSPPSGMPAQEWFSGIAPQLFSLLQGEGEPEMDRLAAFIIGFGILGKKQYGAPNMPGWNAFIAPIYRCIDPSIVFVQDSNDHIVTLSTGKVIAAASEVSRGLQRLCALLTIHPHPSLTKRLLAPIMLPLWCLSSWKHSSQYIDEQFRRRAQNLLKSFLILTTPESTREDRNSESSNLYKIVQGLMFKGNSNAAKLQWVFYPFHDGGIGIRERSTDENADLESELLASEDATTAFVTFIQSMPELDAEISQLFLKLCRSWLSADEGATSLVITHVQSLPSTISFEGRLIEAKVMQKMMTLIPEKLVSDSRQVLDLVDQVLSKSEDSEESQDLVSVALSLLNLVLTNPGFREGPETALSLEKIKGSLERIGRQQDLEFAPTAQNLLTLLRFRRTVDEPISPDIQPDLQKEDRKAYNLALSYLTSVDSPPPVRVQGLEMLSILLKKNSAVLDIQALVVLFSSLLQDSDEYVYLRVIKSFIELSQRHPRTTAKDLVERYVDINEDATLDQRLRFGEALLQVIQSSTRLSGDALRTVCQGLISVASRRGRRPKTEMEQEKQKLVSKKKQQDADDAWGGEAPDMTEDLSEENEILAQIVSGWESKRGTEDVRIRASALSLLGSIIESSVAEVGSPLLSTVVDLSIHILTLEKEIEKGILRRSAILLIMDFTRALDSVRERGKRLGFGFAGQSLDDILHVLNYIADTDNDGLVRQHAKDVIEGLQAWQMNSLIPSQDVRTELQDLNGLSISPAIQPGSAFSGRPRIEEVE